MNYSDFEFTDLEGGTETKVTYKGDLISRTMAIIRLHTIQEKLNILTTSFDEAEVSLTFASGDRGTVEGLLAQLVSKQPAQAIPVPQAPAVPPPPTSQANKPKKPFKPAKETVPTVSPPLVFWHEPNKPYEITIKSPEGKQSPGTFLLTRRDGNMAVVDVTIKDSQDDTRAKEILDFAEVQLRDKAKALGLEGKVSKRDGVGWALLFTPTDRGTGSDERLGQFFEECHKLCAEFVELPEKWVAMVLKDTKKASKLQPSASKPAKLADVFIPIEVPQGEQSAASESPSPNSFQIHRGGERPYVSVGVYEPRDADGGKMILEGMEKNLGAQAEQLGLKGKMTRSPQNQWARLIYRPVADDPENNAKLNSFFRICKTECEIQPLKTLLAPALRGFDISKKTTEANNDPAVISELLNTVEAEMLRLYRIKWQTSPANLSENTMRKLTGILNQFDIRKTPVVTNGEEPTTGPDATPALLGRLAERFSHLMNKNLKRDKGTQDTPPPASM